MKKSILFVACLTSLTSCQYKDAGSAMITKPIQLNNLIEEFNQARIQAIETVNLHLSSHPNCELKDLKLQDKVFLPTDIKEHRLKAFVFVKEDKKRIFFNQNIKWSLKDIIVMMIHEDFHLVGVCGSDSKSVTAQFTVNRKPVCRLFGENQYYSNDITEAIEKHLEKELMEFK